MPPVELSSPLPVVSHFSPSLRMAAAMPFFGPSSPMKTLAIAKKRWAAAGVASSTAGLVALDRPKCYATPKLYGGQPYNLSQNGYAPQKLRDPAPT